MTIKQTLKAINALPGLRARYVSEFKEFQVYVIGNPDATYFTEDRDDALSTARHMIQETAPVCYRPDWRKFV